MRNVQEVRKKYAKTKKIGTIIVLACFAALLAASAVVKEFGESSGWVLLLTMGLFILSIVVFIYMCRCPFCGHWILTGVNARVNCPRCKKQLVDSRENAKKNGSSGARLSRKH